MSFPSSPRPRLFALFGLLAGLVVACGPADSGGGSSDDDGPEGDDGAGAAGAAGPTGAGGAGEAEAPGGGGGGTGGDLSACTGTDVPTFDAVFEQLLVGRGCVHGCHDASSAGKLTLKPTEQGPADIEAAFAALIGATSTTSECGTWERVVPGAPSESLLWRKLAAEIPGSGVTTCGESMPKGAQQIDAADVDLVCRWIAGGAER